jgi:hypothetical protein
MNRILTLILVTFFVFGCAGSKTKDRPVWVDDAAKQYNPKLYLIGRGQGRTVEVAKNKARADLARVFRSAVSDIQKDVQSFASQTRGGQTSQTSNLSVKRQTTVSTDFMLTGAEIVETWHDQEKDYHYALAVMSRSQSAKRFGDQIKELDRQTSDYVKAANKSKDKLTKVGYVYLAIQKQYERGDVQQILQIVNKSGEGIKPRYDISELTIGLNNTANKTLFVTESKDANLKSAVEGALGQSGFKKATGTRYDYKLAASLNKEQDERDGWFWIKGNIELEISDADGNARGIKIWNMKTSAQSVKTAEKRFDKKMAELLNAELGLTLASMAVEAVQ